MVEKFAQNFGTSVCLILAYFPYKVGVYMYLTVYADDRLTTGSSLVHYVAAYGVEYSRYNSLLGYKALFNAQQYNCYAGDSVGGSAYVRSAIEEFQMQTACFCS
jgi:hypothetical protein